MPSDPDPWPLRVSALAPALAHGLADAVLLLHLGVVLFVVAGLLLVLMGHRRGGAVRPRLAWVDRPAFRLAHAAAIAVVVVQAWLGQACTLTLLESALRARAGGSGYERGFIEHWVQALLFHDAPGWVFTLGYTLFGAAVAWAWWRHPPRWQRPGTPRRMRR